MAGIDRIYGTQDQYTQLHTWLLMHEPELLAFLLPIEDYPTDRRPIANFPSAADHWLYENCPLPWLVAYIREQYGGRAPRECFGLIQKARIMGLDERQLELAQADITHVPEQQQAVYEACMRVAIYALAFDNPGRAVVIERYGIGYSPHPDGGATIWRRAPCRY